jgi:uncharacterized protein YdiU (UPF0061 family)
VDWTTFFRALAAHTRGDPSAARDLFTDRPAFDAWARRRDALLAADRTGVAAAMDRVNPRYIPRNHLLEAALTAATDGDLAPVTRLLDVLADPFTERPDQADYAGPAPESFGRHITYCGT